MNNTNQELTYNNYLFNNTTIISAHISDLHFPVMDPYKQYSILEDQFLKNTLL